MAESNDPKTVENKPREEPPPALPPLEPERLSGCGTTAGIIVAIFLLLVVVGFGLFVGACWR
jgi:hypothetical protein